MKISNDYCQWVEKKGEGLSGYFENREYTDRAVYLNINCNGLFDVIHQLGDLEEYIARNISKEEALNKAKDYMNKTGGVVQDEQR